MIYFSFPGFKPAISQTNPYLNKTTLSIVVLKTKLAFKYFTPLTNIARNIARNADNICKK